MHFLKAGIKKDNLTIALEPEAASMYCQYVAKEDTLSPTLGVVKPGTKYILIDLGGKMFSCIIKIYFEIGFLLSFFADQSLSIRNNLLFFNYKSENVNTMKASIYKFNFLLNCAHASP